MQGALQTQVMGAWVRMKDVYLSIFLQVVQPSYMFVSSLWIVRVLTCYSSTTLYSFSFIAVDLHTRRHSRHYSGASVSFMHERFTCSSSNYDAELVEVS
jgi:hypothetical protein